MRARPDDLRFWYNPPLQLSICSPSYDHCCQVKMPSPLSPTEIKYELSHIHDTRAPNIIVSAAICIFLAMTAVLLRLLARHLSKSKILSDDYMMIFALVS